MSLPGLVEFTWLAAASGTHGVPVLATVAHSSVTVSSAGAATSVMSRAASTAASMGDEGFLEPRLPSHTPGLSSKKSRSTVHVTTTYTTTIPTASSILDTKPPSPIITSSGSRPTVQVTTIYTTTITPASVSATTAHIDDVSFILANSEAPPVCTSPSTTSSSPIPSPSTIPPLSNAAIAGIISGSALLFLLLPLLTIFAIRFFFHRHPKTLDIEAIINSKPRKLRQKLSNCLRHKQAQTNEQAEPKSELFKSLEELQRRVEKRKSERLERQKAGIKEVDVWNVPPTVIAGKGVGGKIEVPEGWEGRLGRGAT